MTLSSQAFTSTLSPDVEAERRRAIRALLRNPLLCAAGEMAEEYMLVRRHSEWLKTWLARFPAWNLHVDREVARLRKIPADIRDDTRPAIDRRTGATFTRRKYALLCLALAALEQFDRQTTLDHLARTIMEFVAADRELEAAGMVFDIANYDQRRDLVHAVRLLIDMGVLCKLDGDERQFLDRNESSDVLYDINRHILAAMLHASRSPSALEMVAQSASGMSVQGRAAELTDEPIPATDEGRSRAIRSRLFRVLLDDPMLYFKDLNDEERNYLEKHRGYILRQICGATGFIAEVRAEGIAMVDDAGDVTDLKLPDEGAAGHLNLLLAQWFAECGRNSQGSTIPLSAVEEHIRCLIQIHGSDWHKEVGEAGSESILARDALLYLRALRLIQLTADGVVPLPASGRYGRPATQPMLQSML